MTWADAVYRGTAVLWAALFVWQTYGIIKAELRFRRNVKMWGQREGQREKELQEAADEVQRIREEVDKALELQVASLQHLLDNYPDNPVAEDVRAFIEHWNTMRRPQ